MKLKKIIEKKEIGKKFEDWIEKRKGSKSVEDYRQYINSKNDKILIETIVNQKIKQIFRQ